MEVFYKKLHDKYTKLKTSKFHEMDEHNKDQEIKFLKCITAAEQCIQHLNSENERLKVQVQDLISETTSIRSADDERCVDYQKHLMEEHHKISGNLVSGEVEKLQQLQQEGKLDSSYTAKKSGGKMNSQVEVLSEISNTSLRRSTRKRSRDAPPAKDLVLVLSGNAHDDMHALPEKTVCNETVCDLWQPECCKRRKDESGGIVNSSGDTSSCMYQTLVESLLGMDLSINCQTEGTCISALHKSSGYSFSLTWTIKAPAKETEIIYQTLSLGTFERVAPGWTKEAIRFTPGMSPVFFERVTRFIKNA